MTIEEAERRLGLFGIPVAMPDIRDCGRAGRSTLPADGSGAKEVRDILARILARGALSLSDMQSARDVVEHLQSKDPGAPFKKDGLYLFLAAMCLSLKDGNTFLRIGKGADLLKKAGHMEDGHDAEHNTLVDECWGKHAQAAGDVLARGGQLVTCTDVSKDEKGWFFTRVWNSVQKVSARLSEMANEGDFGELPEEIVSKSVRFNGKDCQYFLNDEQQQAVRTVGKRRFTVVTGGPGTGKTTVVCAILRALMENKVVTAEDVALVAPTGRAGQRMGESIHDQCEAAVGIPPEIKSQIKEMSGATIHTTLGGLPPNWKYTEKNQLPYKLVIADESSMVDVHLMKALLDALPDQCRLVLLGDKDQLPSVDAGAVLGDVVANYDERTVVELKESIRFKGNLAKCARAVNGGNQALFEETVKKLPVAGEVWTKTLSSDIDRVFHYDIGESASSDACRKLVLEWVRNYGLLHVPADAAKGTVRAEGLLVAAAKSVGTDNAVFKDGTKTGEVAALFELLNQSRILTVVREGPFGAVGINDLVITERFGGRRPANPLSKVGVPVIVTRNTRERNLWNGDIGVTVKGPDGMAVLFPRGEKVAVCPVGLLPEHELAYAMTVHKSQGSEFENVMVVLPNDVDHPLLNRQIVYTGITRAKKRAVLVGTKAALDTALTRKVERDTGINRH